ncbi:hypothetical protein NE237_025519 [Protea cynaroides]|uniref:Uncharacterized protein n=1 Tax=Protea cynaroides TaxID=273540 RepID=A0A9Q0H2I4_9MAGN|nr:hypothetical protein NE237_025519 [Protea cynaroides]
MWHSLGSQSVQLTVLQSENQVRIASRWSPLPEIIVADSSSGFEEATSATRTMADASGDASGVGPFMRNFGSFDQWHFHGKRQNGPQIFRCHLKQRPNKFDDHKHSFSLSYKPHKPRSDFHEV